MLTLQSLLNSQGTPPTAVCLDWAWQLLALQPTTPYEGEPYNEQLKWADLEVGEEGRLLIRRADQPHSQSIPIGASRRSPRSKSMPNSSALLETLIEWIERDSTLDCPSSPQDSLEVRVQHLTYQHRRHAKPEIDVSTAPHSPQCSVSARSALSLDSKSDVDAGLAPRRTAEQGDRAAIAPVPAFDTHAPQSPLSAVAPARARQRRRPMLRQRSQQLARWSVGATLVGLLLFISSMQFFAYRSDDDLPSAVAHTSEANSAPRGMSGPLPPKAKVESSPSEAIDSDDFSLGQGDTGLPSGVPFDKIKSNDILSTTTGLPQHVPLAHSGDSPFIDSSALDSSALDSIATDLAPPESEDLADPTRELTDLMQLASIESQELEIPIQAEPTTGEPATDAETGSRTQPPAWLLSTFPVTQSLKFPEAGRLRVKVPEWSLRLAVGPEFESFPPTPQVVAGRNPVAWEIRPSNAAAPPSTLLYVQTRLTNPRSPTLEWRIAAGNQSLPGLMLPAEQNYLDRAHRVLETAKAQMQQEVQHLAILRDSSGFSSQMRATAAKRRRFLKEQSEFCDEALTIVAEANQLLRWLDGQFEVHAELRDLAQPAPAPLLQYGKVDTASNEPDKDLSTAKHETDPTSVNSLDAKSLNAE